MVGNALEVREAMDTLRGQGPRDLKELSLHLAAEMILLGEKAGTFEAAMSQAVDMLSSGAAADKLRQMVAWQGGSWMKRSRLRAARG